MDKRCKKSEQKLREPAEYTCRDCLYFQALQAHRRPLKGNCSLHKQWIERPTLTTCSEMSEKNLVPQGIYELVATSGCEWKYVRREVRQGAQLFLVAGKSGRNGGGRGSE